MHVRIPLCVIYFLLYINVQEAHMSTIILLNGAGSSGKTSIAKAIQHLDNKPWIRLGIDTFIDMMPTAYVGVGPHAQQGFIFCQTKDENDKVTTCVSTGPVGTSLISTMPDMVKIMADRGLNIIVDEVLLDAKRVYEYVHALQNCTVYFVGVVCNLKEMEEREILRGDRAIGLSRDQIKRIHHDISWYDLVVDTTSTSSFVCAQQIISFIHTNTSPHSFIQLKNKILM